jgi:Zinc-ribbon containing domain
MSQNKFTEAYDNLMGHLYEIMDDGLHSLAHGLELAKEKTSALGGLTQEEIHKIGSYLKRDVEGAATSLNASQEENLSDWLKFDIDLLENFALDAFMGVADKTSLELAQLKRHAETNLYIAGEITGPGTFSCVECNKVIAFKSTSEIPVCPACGTNSFVRN